MNGKATGKTIHDVVSSITNSKLGKALTPTVDELNQTIVNSSRLSEPLYNEKIHTSLTALYEQRLKISQEEASKIASSVNVKNYAESIDNLSEEIGKHTDNVDKVIETSKSRVEKILSEKPEIDYIGSSKNAKINKTILYPQAYFMNPDKKIRGARIATAAIGTAGAVSTVAVGGRLLSGGTLTQDSYGRKDIAGIPFI